jgi:hypothetical protein
MPQFDKITFFNRVFWLLSFFSVFYLIFLKFFLPKLSSILKVRTKKLRYEISSNSTKASKNEEDIFSSSVKLSSFFVTRASLIPAETFASSKKPVCVYKFLTIANIIKTKISKRRLPAFMSPFTFFTPFTGVGFYDEEE